MESPSQKFINPHHLLALTDIHAVQNFLTNEMYSGLYEKGAFVDATSETVVRALTNLTKVKDPRHSHHVGGDVISRVEAEEFNRNLQKGQKPILHEPVLHGMNQIPSLASNDWMAQLNYRELHSTLQQTAARDGSLSFTEVTPSRTRLRCRIW